MARAPKATTVAAAPLPSKQGQTIPVIVTLSILLVMALGSVGYMYYHYIYNTAERASARELQSIASEVGRLMILPEGEEPTLATVTDKGKLAEQPFFQKAENGDKILIYTNHGRAILYRPSTKKIVDVTTVNIKAPETAAAPAAQPETAPVAEPAPETTPVITTTPTLALYNGSAKVGATNTLEAALKEKFSDLEVVTKDKAARNDYRGNLVIDLSGKYADFAQRLADNFDGVVGTLPEGEAAPEAGILIIVGNAQ